MLKQKKVEVNLYDSESVGKKPKREEERSKEEKYYYKRDENREREKVKQEVEKFLKEVGSQGKIEKTKWIRRGREE